MIVILNFSPTPLTAAQRFQIVESSIEHADDEFIVNYPKARVIDVTLLPDPVETVEAIPLTPGEWVTFAIVVYIPSHTQRGAELLRLVNERRGYEWPVVVLRDQVAALESIAADEWDVGRLFE